MANLKRLEDVLLMGETMIIKKRYFLSNKDKKKLIDQLSLTFGDSANQFINKADKLEYGKAVDGREFIFKDNKIWFFYYEKVLLPTIICLRQIKHSLLRITVDIGAIKFLLNGADVMAPGITFFDKEIKKDDFLVVTEEQKGTIIALGQALVDYSTFAEKRKGKVVKNIHHLKDELWDFVLV